MSKLEVGQRVRVTNPKLIHFGREGKVTAYAEIMCEPAVVIILDGERSSFQYKETSLTPTPSVITIDRAELPEVTVKDVYGREYLVVDGSTYANELSADEWKKSADRRYALAEFLEAREKAAEEATQKRDQRREELDGLSRTALVECIIELENQMEAAK